MSAETERARVLRIIDDALANVGGEAQTALQIVRDEIDVGAALDGGEVKEWQPDTLYEVGDLVRVPAVDGSDPAEADYALARSLFARDYKYDADVLAHAFAEVRAETVEACALEINNVQGEAMARGDADGAIVLNEAQGRVRCLGGAKVAR